MPSALNKSAAELARLSSGELAGDGALMLEGAAGLREAGPKDVSFLGNPKYAPLASQTKAGCVFLPKSNRSLACPAPSRIYVDDPQFAFSLVLAALDGLRPRPSPGIDPRASIHPEARVGSGVHIGAFTVVGRRAVIGDGTVLHSQVYVGDDVRVGRQCTLYPRVVVREECALGDRVILQPGVVIGGDGYGFSTDRKTGRHRKIPQIGNVVVEDDVEIGANAAIDRGTTGSTVIGSGTKIDNLVQIGHNVQVGNDCLIVSQAGVSGSTVLGDRVILAGQAGLVGHINIGEGAIVTAKTGVMSDIAPGEIVFGIPSRPHREAMKLQALYGKLPEIYDAVRRLKRRLGAEDSAGKETEDGKP